MTQDEYRAEVERCGGTVAALARTERAAALHAWRAVYAAAYFAAKGKWKHGQYEWHVFSFGYTRAVQGDRAVEGYRAQPAAPFLVVPEDRRWPAFRCAGGGWPDFAATRLDVYVWPTDLDWTMAFTHEQDSGLGPYFCPREWAGQGTWEPPAGRPEEDR